MQVVGKRHFGRKAVPHGGGGGGRRPRTVRDAAVLEGAGDAGREWRGERAGAAQRFADGVRIVAVASAAPACSAPARTDIRSSQDLMLLSGLPRWCARATAFRAGFTLRNASTEANWPCVWRERDGRRRQGRRCRRTCHAGAGRGARSGLGLPGAGRRAAKPAWESSAGMAAGAAGARERPHAASRRRWRRGAGAYHLQATLLQLDRRRPMQVQAPGRRAAGRGGIQTTSARAWAATCPACATT
jgi:hypothetical protein